MGDNKKVVDMFSRTSVDKLVNGGVSQEEVDKGVHELGTYIGSLPKSLAEDIRSQNAMLALRASQLTALHAELEQMQMVYGHLLGHACAILKLNPNSLVQNQEDLFIANDGHVWSVPVTSMADFAKMLADKEKSDLN